MELRVPIMCYPPVTCYFAITTDMPLVTVIGSKESN